MILNLFFEGLKNGLAMGSVFALMALGYSMVYGIVKLINFAHGDILMVGAYAGYFVLMAFGANPWTFCLAMIFATLGFLAPSL